MSSAGTVLSKPWALAQAMMALALSTRRDTYKVRGAASESLVVAPSSSASSSGTSLPNSSRAASRPGKTLFSTSSVAAASLRASAGNSLVSPMILIVSAVVLPISARSFAVVCQRLFQM
ncbi:hypothetical protein D9M70_547590 [compost metagenome]